MRQFCSLYNLNMRFPQFHFPVNQASAAIASTLTIFSLIFGPYPAPAPVAPTPISPVSPAPGAAKRASDVTPNRSIKDPYEIAWSSWEKVDGANAVRIFYTSGVPACYGQYADVVETRSKVTIRLYSGSVPNAPDACISLAVNSSMVVPLKAPLGNRKVVQVARY